ncbi:hypothetical protein RHEC894_PC00257 (plasmid) [Rhizobium sp. CIAT894]|nr:hypothetical protein RHEC894_PC00257 [Rhizobium sp. CIAT894]
MERFVRRSLRQIHINLPSTRPLIKENDLLGASEQLAWCLLIPGYKRQKAVCIMPVHETNGTEAT